MMSTDFPQRLLLVLFVALSVTVTSFENTARSEEAATTHGKQQVEFFEKEVRTILEKNCHACHSGAEPKGGLRLDWRGGLLEGGDSGPAVALDEPKTSLLLEAVNYESYEMPPRGKLPQASIDVLAKWVEMGLPWTPGPDRPPAVAAEHGPPQVNDETRNHWSYRPIARPDAPEVEHKNWVKTPIDAFLLARLQQQKLRPNDRASKIALVRRAFYDLTGLPPQPADVQSFLDDESPDAWENLIDRLLASPHYGEHWARHWLDLVRYAETNSYERDGPKPFVWRYRDYVIRSLNDDKPYDQFVREQLAGDELDEPSPESIIATGYYRLGIWDDEPVDRLQAEFDDLDDIVKTTGEVFLGMTIGCARCHDHKLDPIPQHDYYSMLAFFRNIRPYGIRAHDTVLDASVRMVGPEEKLRQYRDELATWKRDLADTERQLGDIERAFRRTLKGGEVDDFKHENARVDLARKRVPEVLTQEQFDRYVSLTERRNRLRRGEPEGLMQALCVKERGSHSPPTHVLIRGNAGAPGDQVDPAFPQVLGFEPPTMPPSVEGAASSGRRRVLADWIASKQNPLTARVIANRLWQFHFGRGLVRTANDFGLQGDRPTHPELLDWLASELMAGEWRLKRMHKLIMMSAAYQMSSQANESAYAIDPQNDLFWRFDMRRLTAEEVRDSILAVNGSLNREKMFGESIYTKIPREVLAGQSRPGAGWGLSSPEDRARRSIYIHVKRSLVPPLLAAFDLPETDFTCPVRFVSTQPTQSLTMLNSELVNEQAKVFADYLKEHAAGDPRAQVALALRRVTQRAPLEADIDRGVDLIERLKQQHGASDDVALQQFCLMALNLNEFIYLD
ncbi:MAG: PSD1 and planctomycete cytochrome C domain-containing protein [Pirellulaceae bacterium]